MPDIRRFFGRNQGRSSKSSGQGKHPLLHEVLLNGWCTEYIRFHDDAFELEEDTMQFHLNGFRVGDPTIEPALVTALKSRGRLIMSAGR